MKKIKKMIALITLALMIPSLGACFNRDPGIEIDTTKTQLYVQYINGAYGQEWMNKLIERFESYYAEESFEEDKVGVQIVPDPTKSIPLNTLSLSPYHVFFAESVNYFNMATKGDFLDISDIVTEKKLPDEEKVIADKLEDAQKSFLPTINDKYYALPFTEAFNSIMYDVDLFDEYGFYFAKAGGFIVNDEDERSAGPDGELGTNDDGLPATINDYLALMGYMVNKGVTPFIWTGEHPNYVRTFLIALAANLEGREEFFVNFSYDSNGKEITVWDDSKAIPANWEDAEDIPTKSVVVTPENGYLANQQLGYLYALKFFENIIKSPEYYDERSRDRTETHLDAQEDFVFSKLENKPVAMLLERLYWENEAKGAFERSLERYPSAPKVRNFGFMPLPTSYNGEKTGKQTLVDFVSSYVFINGYITNPVTIDLAKKFIQFAYTDVSLKEFTLVTNTTRAQIYDLTDNEVNQLTTFGQSVWDMKKNSDIMRIVHNSRLSIENSNKIMENIYYTTGERESGGKFPNSFPSRAMIGKDSLTAEEYFKGMRVSVNDWYNRFGTYFNN